MQGRDSCTAPALRRASSRRTHPCATLRRRCSTSCSHRPAPPPRSCSTARCSPSQTHAGCVTPRRACRCAAQLAAVPAGSRALAAAESHPASSTARRRCTPTPRTLPCTAPPAGYRGPPVPRGGRALVQRAARCARAARRRRAVQRSVACGRDRVPLPDVPDQPNECGVRDVLPRWRPRGPRLGAVQEPERCGKGHAAAREHAARGAWRMAQGWAWCDA